MKSMKVYVVMYEHANDTGIVDIYKSEEAAREAVEDHHEGARENHNIIDFYVEEHTVR
jgi:hypothetical protein